MEHALPAGRAAIDALDDLGRALGYQTTREHVVGRTAAVDLSWTAADSNDVPLFVFEVESTASAGLANNALKIFGTPTDSLPKPLFFFHLVVAASPENERIRNAQQMWGHYNYRVYRLADASQRLGIFAEVLKQHRRVSNRIEVLSVADVADHEFWGDDGLVDEILTQISRLHFDTAFLYSSARIAITRPALLPHFTNRLRALESVEYRAGKREGYRDGPGSYVPGMLEISIRLAAGDLSDAEGPDVLEKWAVRSGPFPRTIDAAFGLSRDYDGFVLGIAPFQYALCAATLAQHPESRAWLFRDLNRLIQAEGARGVDADFRLPAAVWLAVMLIAEAAIHQTDSAITLDELEEMYETSRQVAESAGGVPDGWLSTPPAPFSEPEDFHTVLQDAAVRFPLPPLNDLTSVMSSSARVVDRGFAASRATTWCLTALTSLEGYERSTSELVELLGSSSAGTSSPDDTAEGEQRGADG